MTESVKLDDTRQTDWISLVRTRFDSNGQASRYLSDFFEACSAGFPVPLSAEEVKDALRPSGCKVPSWPFALEGEEPEEDEVFIDGTCNSKRPMWMDRLSAYAYEADMIRQRSEEITDLARPRGIDHWSERNPILWSLVSMALLREYSDFMLDGLADVTDDCPMKYIRHAKRYMGHLACVEEMDKVIETRLTAMPSGTATEAQSNVPANAEPSIDPSHMGTSTKRTTEEGDTSLAATVKTSGTAQISRGGAGNRKGKGKNKAKVKAKPDTASIQHDFQIYLTNEAVAKVKVLRAAAEVIKTSFIASSAAGREEARQVCRKMREAISFNDRRLSLFHTLSKASGTFMPTLLDHLRDPQLLTPRAVRTYDRSEQKARTELDTAYRELANALGETDTTVAKNTYPTSQLTTLDIVDAFNAILCDTNSHTTWYTVNGHLRQAETSPQVWQDLQKGLAAKTAAQANSTKKRPKGSVWRRQHRVWAGPRLPEPIQDSEAPEKPSSHFKGRLTPCGDLILDLQQRSAKSKDEKTGNTHKCAPPADPDKSQQFEDSSEQEGAIATPYQSSYRSEEVKSCRSETSLQQGDVIPTPSRRSVDSDRTDYQKGFSDWIREYDVEPEAMRTTDRRKSLSALDDRRVNA